MAIFNRAEKPVMYKIIVAHIYYIKHLCLRRFAFINSLNPLNNLVCEVGAIILHILLMRDLRHREVV